MLTSLRNATLHVAALSTPLFEPFGAGSLGRLVVNLVISISWLAWFTLSPDVPRLFINGAQRKP